MAHLTNRNGSPTVYCKMIRVMKEGRTQKTDNFKTFCLIVYVILTQNFRDKLTSNKDLVRPHRVSDKKKKKD